MFEQYVSIFVKIERRLGDITSPWWNKRPSMGIEWGYFIGEAWGHGDM
jgi:hypothetical protein